MSELNTHPSTDNLEQDSSVVVAENTEAPLSTFKEKLTVFLTAVKEKARKIKFVDDWFNLSTFQRKKKIKKACKITFLSILWFVGLIALYICLSNLYQQSFNPSGYTGFFHTGQAVVASNSMDNPSYVLNGEEIPNSDPIKKSDWIFYKSVTVDDVNPGDIIIYRKTDSNSNETLIVHRLIEKKENGQLIAKGDHNLSADAPIQEADLVGKYMFKIDGFGAVLNLLSTPWLFAMIVLTVLAFIGGKVLWYYLHKRTVINAISTNTENKTALDRFFDL